MGEKQGKEEGEKKKDEKKAEATNEEKGDEKKKKKKEEKKDDGGFTMVMKMDLHCEGCARRVKHFIKKCDGVDEVRIDLNSNKITVVGMMDGLKLKEGLESKTKKKVDIISPNPLPKPAEKKEEKKVEKKPEEKKNEKQAPPPVKVVVLKIRLHCDGCIQKIKRIIGKIKGVQSVAVEDAKDLVTVKGTMDVKALPEYLKLKLRRGVEIVSQKEEAGGGGEKKGGGEKPKEGGGDKKDGGDKKKDGGGEKKDGGNGKKDGGGDKKKDGDGGEKKKDGDGGEKKKPVEDAAAAPDAKKEEAAKVEVNKMEYQYSHYGPAYAVEYVHAPQLFSDENPNACSVM
ncbi:heavy metal-associated isoprenylated plant protein 3-like [Nymphaea colorata]|nr:heavy metal-associated isoprenylated plant protein 3-like [Nymphaea colorata]